MNNVQTEYSVGRLPRVLAPWANVALGVAAIITPFIVGDIASRAITVSDVITGIVILVVALVSYGTSRQEGSSNVSIINVLAGIWLVISSSFANTPMLAWDNVMLGVICIVIALATMGEHDHYLRCLGGRRQFET